MPPSAVWLLDANMTVRSLTILGTVRWDTAADGLELSAGYVLVERGGTFELGTYDEPMLLRATIRLLDNQKTHPYFGGRFLGIDGLASTALDPLAVATPARPTVTIFVALPDDVEPGQTFNVEHGGQVCGLHERALAAARLRQCD